MVNYKVKEIDSCNKEPGDCTIVKVRLQQSILNRLLCPVAEVEYTVLYEGAYYRSAVEAKRLGGLWTIDENDFLEYNKPEAQLKQYREKKIFELCNFFNDPHTKKLGQSEYKEALVVFLESLGVKATNNVNNQFVIEPCFNPQALPLVKMEEQFSLQVFDETYLENDARTLSMLMFDKETGKYMSQFYGMHAKDNIEAYLANTLLTTTMGIAFAYVIRLNAGMCGMIKVTSPVHNKETNNFEHWLIDYITIPPFRNQKIMKSALPIVLDIMKRRLEVKEVYAMVLPSNSTSIHLLELNGFSVDKDKSKQMSKDQHSGEKPLCYKKLL